MILMVAKPEFIFWSGYSHPFHAKLTDLFKDYPFTFSRPIGKWKKGNEKNVWIVYRMRVLISSIPDVEIEVLRGIKEVFPDFEIRWKRHKSGETLITQSPILSYVRHNGKYIFLDPENPAFSQKINETLKKRAENIGYDFECIEIAPLETKPVIFKFKEKVTYTSHNGKFKLRGRRKDVRFALWTGISKKSQQGLGLLTGL